MWILIEVLELFDKKFHYEINATSKFEFSSESQNKNRRF